MDKVKIFENELKSIASDDVRQFAEKAIELLPDYFFEVAASSTGKYHPSYALGNGGLVRHTKAAVRFAVHVFELEQLQDEFDSFQRDLIITALILHDGWKHGTDGSMYTTHEHPITAANWIRECDDLNGIISNYDREIISGLVASHMGQWCKTNRSKVVLPKPQTSMQKFVHLCDYLASRKDIEVLFDKSEPLEEKAENSLEEYVLNFGKHNGELLIDVYKNDPGYIRWLKGTEIRNHTLKAFLNKLN